MNKAEYSSAIKKTQFAYLPSVKVAKQMRKGLIYEQVFATIYDKNTINIQSEARRREVINVVYSRLRNLDDYLLNAFLDGSIATSKFILVYAIAKADKLFTEFLFSLYREALVGDKKYISISDFEDFFDSAKERNKSIAKWSVYTISDLAGGYRNILVESGLGHRVRKNVYADKALIDPAVVNHIKEVGDGEYIRALLGEEK